MSRFTDAVKAALKSYFETGDQPTESQFAEVFDRTQEGIQEHGHTASGGAGTGTGDAGPVANLQSGTSVAKPANPEVGDIYIETDTSKVYACYSAGVWTEVAGGGGGAPTDASYVTINAEGGLSAETQHKNITGDGLHDPKAHAASHQNGGADEISVAGLSGELANDQPPKAHDLAGGKHNPATLAQLNAKVSDATLDDSGDPRDPKAHASNHEKSGGDEISVAGLSGELADDQPPKAHDLAGSKHNPATLAQLNAKISDATLDDSGDPRDPKAHASSHAKDASDELKIEDLSTGDAEGDQVFKADGLGGGSWGAEPVGGFYDAYVCVRDKKTQNTPGGTFQSGAWRTRDINEELADTADICSIASNQITLAAGTYRCHISAPAFSVDRHQLRLYNVTDSALVLVGSSAGVTASTPTNNHAFIDGRFTLAAQKTLEIQHQCQSTYNTLGFGIDDDFTDEIYAVAEFWREV